MDDGTNKSFSSWIKICKGFPRVLFLDSCVQEMLLEMETGGILTNDPLLPQKAS